MNPVQERRTIEEALSRYRSLLDEISDDRFAETPPMGGWSYAEVYDHILKATLGASIALERCSHNNCEPTKDGVTLLGRYTLLTGSFPPFKIKSPPETGIVKKIDKEETKNLIIKVRKRVEGIAGQIKEARPQSKHRHPRMGMLNAGQWLKFMRIHLQHHLKQLQRIKNNFNKN